MRSIILAQWMKERRTPYLVLMFLGLSIVMTLFFGMSTESKTVVAVFSDDEVALEEEERWIELLNDSEAYTFRVMNESKARSNVREGRANFALRIMQDDYRIVAAVDDPGTHVAEAHIRTVFERELQLRSAITSSGGESGLREAVGEYMANPPLLLETVATDGKPLIPYSMGLQLLYGFCMFMAAYTISFKINEVLKEKVSGVWNRVILSPVSKTQMYLGHLLYTAFLGILQVMAVLFLFKYLFGFPLGDRMGLIAIVVAIYIVSVVALAMLFTGFLRTPEQFTTVFSSLLPVLPLLAGVYVPPGVFSNTWLLAVGELVPLTHAMKALVGISIYNYGWQELLLPLAKLLLFTVVCMGVGINLVERGRR